MLLRIRLNLLEVAYRLIRKKVWDQYSLIQLPLTLSIISVMLVEIQKEKYAIPLIFYY